jgi:histidinol-phosphate aminotransferase
MDRRAWLRRAGTAAAAGLAVPYVGFGSAAPWSTTLRAASTRQGPVRLNLNENPYGPSPAAREAIITAMHEVPRYPGEALADLVRLIAEREDVPEDHVLVGAGSTEVLNLAGIAFGLEGGEMVAAEPTFTGLMRYAETVGASIQWVPLDETMRHDLDAMERCVTTATRLVYVCNPNNPTGTIVPTGRLRDFCETVSGKTTVFVDEAYLELVEGGVEHSAVDLVRAGHNVIVARTFSKVHGLAGLRVGYGIAQPDLIRAMRRYQMAGTSIPGARAAAASIRDDAFIAFSIDRISAAKAFTYSHMERLGYGFVPSFANFVFFDTGRPAPEFIAEMRARQVIVGRPFAPYDTWCRVSMGLASDMDVFVQALEEVTDRG